MWYNRGKITGKRGVAVMASKTGIKLGTIIDTFHLDVLYGPEGYRDRMVTI